MKKILEKIVKIRIPFQLRLDKEVLIFCFFLLLSTVFWVINLLRESVEMGVRFSVNITEIPDNIIITDSLPKQVTLTLYDKGMYIIPLSLKGDPTIDIPYKAIQKEKEALFIDTRTIETYARNSLSNSCEIKGLNPSMISLIYTQGQGVHLPIKLMANFTTTPQTMITGKPQITPSSITVHAPSSILGKLTHIETETKSYTELSDTLKVTLKLKKRKGVRLQTQEVEVVVPIERFTQKNFEVPIITHNIPEGYILRTFPKLAKLSCYVSLSQFKEFMPNDVKVVLEYNSELLRAKKKQPLKISESPEWIKNIKLETDSVDVILEQKLTFNPSSNQ